jgi:hypothetical protein
VPSLTVFGLKCDSIDQKMGYIALNYRMMMTHSFEGEWKEVVIA